MKKLYIHIACLSSLFAYPQLINRHFSREKNESFYSCKNEIEAKVNEASIITKVIYNAVPDGYHAKFSSSFICKTTDEIKTKINKKMDSLISKIALYGISNKDVVVDLVSMDPLFDFNRDDNDNATRYKITQNITFNLNDISQLIKVSKTCFDFGIYDLVTSEPYINNTKYIFDSLEKKTVEELEVKKKLCKDLGWQFVGGKPSLTQFKHVFYPSELYMHSYIKNASLYKHHLAQNSTIKIEREVNVDIYNSLNLKDADYVFNSKNNVPVIQFYYELNYKYIKENTEAEMREKIKNEENKKNQKTIYVVDKNGELKKIDI